jgi:hypothetical protein
MNLGSPDTSKPPFVLLTPDVQVAPGFGPVRHDKFRHEHLLANMQRLRGGVYLADRAIRQSEVQPDGRHIHPADSKSWHLLLVDPNDESKVLGCTRYLTHDGRTSFNQLRVGSAALARCQKWGARFRKAVEQELARARQIDVPYVEVGGWALDDTIRFTTDALRSVLAAFAWTRLMGGALGVATVTERNGSASILRRLGGRPLEHERVEIPPYFDPAYNCRMEVLRFDSGVPNPKYESVVQSMAGQLAFVPVISAGVEHIHTAASKSPSRNFGRLRAAA